MAAFTVSVLVLLLCFPVVLLSPLLSLPVDGTACDWNVWDDTTEEKSVQKISVRCTEGEVTWRTPYGGLAIVFLPVGKSQFYELCFIARSTFATVQLFSEGNQSLRHLALLKGTASSLTHEICVNSTADQPITIFAETDSSSSSPVVGKVVLEYDVKSLDSLSANQMQECSPCSEEEIVLAACTADYAVIGQIHSISEDDVGSTTDLHIVVSDVIRQRLGIVKDFQRSHRHDQVVRHKQSKERHKRDKIEDRFQRGEMFLSDSSSQKHGDSFNLTVVVPKKCHIKHGDGIFAFFGNIRLRRARLGCAPRLEEFQRIWGNALTNGNNLCVL